MPGTEKIMETSPTPLIAAMDPHVPAHPERRASEQTQVFDRDFTAQLEASLNEADIPTVETPIVQIPEARSAEHGQLPAQNSRKRTLGILLSVGAFAAAAFVSGLLSADKKPSAKVAPTEATTSTTNLPSTTTSSTPTTLQQFRPAVTLESTTSSTQAPTTTTAAANRMPINIDIQAIITDALESLQATTTTAARRPTTTAATSTTTSVPPVTTARPAPTVTTQQSVPNNSFTPAP